MESFLLRHADTLEYLQLGEISLLDADWPECFSEFAGKLPNLKVVDLRGGFENQFGEIFYDFGILIEPCDDDYSQALSEYVLHGGARCPVPWDDSSDEEISHSEGDDPDGESS
ncbi:hypothetical protein Slin14017_G103850 [Septoria linicola]|nr:hypothetical protein Slin14017_G103850 [Septoria linicola]